MKQMICLRIYHSNSIIKILFIMEKSTMKIIYEIVKAIVYALGGFFGGNALM